MLSLFKVFMKTEEILQNLKPVLESGYTTQGVKVEEFEKKLQEYFNHPYILTLNSATSGLTLALKMLDLEVDDEVLCTALTCFATTSSVLANGLSIKWVDVDPKTCNMDLNDLADKISDKTKAILVVHWGGNPVDMAKLNAIRDHYNIPVIEDCAHSFGSKYDDTFIGTHGNIAVFSLQSIKHLSTGDGGLILLPDKPLYNRAKLLRWYGISREDRGRNGDHRMEPDITESGFKYHMNDINATIGLSNLPYIQDNIDYTRECVKSYYDNTIDGLENITRIKETIGADSAYWIYSIRVPNKEGFIKYMKKHNIMVSQVHNRNDIHSCVSQFKKWNTILPQLDELEKDLICIPCGWWLTDEHYEYISDKIEWWDTNYKRYNDFTIRPIEQTDISYLQLLSLENILSQTEFEERLRQINSQSMGTIYVIQHPDDNKVIATAKLFIELKFGDSVAHIEDVAVDIKWRGIGLGSKMVNKLVEISRHYKCYKVILDAKESLTPFYENCGFTNEGKLFTKRMMDT